MRDRLESRQKQKLTERETLNVIFDEQNCALH